MRILILTATYVPSTNGVAITAYLQKKELEKRGHKVTVVAPIHPRQRKETGVIRIPSLPNPIVTDYPLPLVMPDQIYKKLVRSKYDLVHFHHPFIIGNIALKISKTLGVSSVFFYHTLYEEYLKIYLPALPKKEILEKLVRKQVKRIASKSDQVIVETETIKEKLLSEGYKTPISVIPSYRHKMAMQNIDKHGVRTRYGLSPESTFALCVARLSKEKNLDALIRICASEIDKKDFQLYIVGGGPELKNLISLRNSFGEQAENNIHFLGSVDHNDLAEIYSSADLFLYPSKTDTQAVVISEAMSAGLPIIAFNVSGPKDFIKNNKNGYLANNNNEFKFYLDKLLNNNRLLNLFSRNSISMASHFSIEHTIDRTENLFRQLIKKNEKI